MSIRSSGRAFGCRAQPFWVQGTGLGTGHSLWAQGVRWQQGISWSGRAAVLGGSGKWVQGVTPKAGKV